VADAVAHGLDQRRVSRFVLPEKPRDTAHFLQCSIKVLGLGTLPWATIAVTRVQGKERFTKLLILR
jgi:hypothetical protein